MVMPGEQGSVNIVLRVPMMILEGDRFTMRMGKFTVGTGMVTAIMDVQASEDIFDKKIMREIKKKQAAAASS